MTSPVEPLRLQAELQALEHHVPTPGNRIAAAELQPEVDIDFAAALSPFERKEQTRLRRHVERVERLKACSFFERGAHTITVHSTGEYEMPTAPQEDDEAIDSLFVRVRNLYSPGRQESASFTRTIALLRAHLTDGAAADALRLELDAAEERVERILTETGMGLIEIERDAADAIVRETVFTPGEIFEDWLYGDVLHDDEDRIRRVERWRAMGVHRYIALGTAMDLANFYVGFAQHIVAPILADLSLAPETAPLPLPDGVATRKLIVRMKVYNPATGEFELPASE